MSIDKQPQSNCQICGGTHQTSEHKPDLKDKDIKPTNTQRIIVDFADTPSRQKMYQLRSPEAKALDYAEGWKTLGELTKLFRPGEKSLEMLIAPLRLSHPEWFAVRKTARGAEAEHFHPDLISLIEKQIKEVPPDDWKPASNFGKNVTQIASITARVHPEITRPYTAPDGPNRGQFILYYSPRFFVVMDQWINELQQRTFPIGTTPESLDAAFGVLEHTAPLPKTSGSTRTIGDARKTPYTKEEIDAARDIIIEKIREDLVEDADRQKRARKTYGKIRGSLIQSRLEDEEESEKV